MNPRWMRNHVACPECGHIYKTEADWVENVTSSKGIPIAIDCPNCKAHFTDSDFWKEQHEKWDRTMKETQ